MNVKGSPVLLWRHPAPLAYLVSCPHSTGLDTPERAVVVRGDADVVVGIGARDANILAFLGAKLPTLSLAWFPAHLTQRFLLGYHVRKIVISVLPAINSKPIHVLQKACAVYAQLMGYIVNGTKSNHILSFKELGQLFVRWDNPPGGPIALAAAILALSLPFRQAARRRLRKLLATLSAQFREHLSLPKSGAPSGLAVLLSDSTSLSHWGHEKTNPPFWYSRPTRMIIPCS